MVVLATKVYVSGESRRRAIDSLETLVADAVDELTVTVDIGIRHDDFPSVTIEGPDATVARNLLRDEFGEITPEGSAGDIAYGTLESWDEDGFVLDAGREVRIVPSDLGLGTGTPSQVRTRFGLVQHVPLRFEPGDSPSLAPVERDRLFDWTRETGGRVNVNSATRSQVRATVNRAGHAKDIVTVERLGLLEQSVVCREGTDSPGLLSSIGKYLQSEMLAVVP
ncbi:MAG: DUF2110 family protein [Halodesulfurarchaeum sp.]